MAEDVRKTYERMEPAENLTQLIHEDKAVVIAAFPEAALAHYRGLVTDPRADRAARMAALDGLGVLARAQHPEVKRLFVEAAEKVNDEAVRERATALLGHYYYADDVKNLLLRRALAGSQTAILGLSYYPTADLSVLRTEDSQFQAAHELADMRIGILRDPMVRVLLQQVITQERTLDRGKPQDNLLWAIKCAGRLGYSELADEIRAALPRLGKKIIGRDPEEFEYWKHRSDEPAMAEGVRALAQLNDLTEMERRYLDYFVLTGKEESARISLEIRSATPYYSRVLQLLSRAR